MTVDHIIQPKPPAVAYVKVAVPEGKQSGDVIPYVFSDGGKRHEVQIVVPGKGLRGGDTFEVADPASAVTVHGREASARNVHCRACQFCGPYDEVDCCSEPVSHIARWICVASSPYCCVGMLLLFGISLLIMASTIFTINETGGEFPTLSVQGDLDPNSVYTLQGWALDVLKEESAASLVVSSAAESNATDDSNATVIPQTSIKGDWGLLLIFRVRGDAEDTTRNILTTEGLEFVKTIQDTIIASSATDINGNATYPSYEDVCLKSAVNASFFDVVEITNETELECTVPTSPLLYYYPTLTDSGVHTMYGYPFFDMLDSAEAIVDAFNLTLQAAAAFFPSNDYLADNIDVVSLNAAQPSPGTQTLVFDGRGTSLVSCALDEYLVTSFVPQQIDDFSCIASPYLMLLTLAEDPSSLSPLAVALGTADHVFNDSEVDALGGPVVAGVEGGAPFCSQCYSGSCTCNASNPNDAIDSVSRLITEVPYLAYFFGANFNASNLKSPVMSFSWSFGGPLEGFRDTNDWEETSIFGPPGNQTQIFSQFASEVYPTLDAYGYDADTDIEIVYFWNVALADITLDLLIHDMTLVSGSILFIFCYMWFHTRSVCLTAMGLIHILASFPLAFLGYYYVFGIEPFYTLNFLSVYVILAIGADDVFVMVDAWKQFGHLSPSKRMQKAFARASKAMLITSLTTAAAFLATSFSALLDISTFGLYTSFLVIANYVSVVTYYIGVIMFFHLYMEYGCCCFARWQTAVPPRKCCECLTCDRRKQLEMRLEDELYATYVAEASESMLLLKPAAVASDNGAAAPGSASESKLSVASPMTNDGRPSTTPSPKDDGDVHVAVTVDAEPVHQHMDFGHKPRHTFVPLEKLDMNKPEVPVLEKFCGDNFFEFIRSGVNRFVFPAVLLALTIGMAYCASQLGPTTQADAFLPTWHPIQRFIDIYTTEFAVSSDTSMKTVSVVFGLDPDAPMDRSAYGRYELDFGPLQFYETTNGDSCDFSDPAAQAAIWDICSEFALLTPTGVNADGDDEFLVRQGSGLGELEVNCWLLEFKPWYEQRYNATFPVTANATAVIREFLTEFSSQGFSVPSKDFDDKVLIEDDIIKSVSFTVNSTLSYYSVVYVDTNNAKVAWDNWLAETLSNHDVECLRSAMHVAEDRDKAWVFLNTQDLLITGAFIGTGSSLAVALVILWLATGNIIVALLATVNMVCVTVCILGFMYVLGWELGTIESVSATVLVGLSVDYVVHLAQAYVEADAVSREARVRSALLEMGSTVFGGAITSLGASAFLFGCWIQYFFKFGGFMFLTIGLSFLFCFFFFMPIMLICGPERSVAIDGKLYDAASFGCCCRCGGIDADRSQEAVASRNQRRRELEMSVLDSKVAPALDDDATGGASTDHDDGESQLSAADDDSGTT